jgi:hypothetical protein
MLPILVFIFKLTAYFFGIGVFVQMFRVGLAGRTVAAWRKSPTREIFIKRHTRNLKCLWWLIGISLVLVEGFEHFLLPAHEHSPWLPIHLHYFAWPYIVLLFATNVWFTGRRYPQAHKWFAYITFAFGGGASVLGMYITHTLKL